MILKYFTSTGGESYVFEYGDNYEMWYFHVSKEGMGIDRGSEDHGGSIQFPHLAEVICEMTDIYRSLQERS